MKRNLLVSLLIVCLPMCILAQDDLYFVPKKKTEKKVSATMPSKVVVEKEKNATTLYTATGSTVVVKDVKGNIRDVDEYNRRYTSRDNTFTMENDTLYIEEKPYNERGEWVNGFEGSQEDYEYAMRIVRFRNPRYAIPVSSPLYWDVLYSFPSWDWNVFDDGLYAYVFPTYTNRLWWDWRYRYPWGASWNFSWAWHSPWWDSWYGPGYWGGGYWGHHHHLYPHWSYGPMYAGVGGYWGGGHGRYGSTAHNPGIHAGRYKSSLTSNNIARTSNRRQVSSTGTRTRRDAQVNTRQSRQNTSDINPNNPSQNTVRRSSSGRVVRSNTDNPNSVRPRITSERNRNGESGTIQKNTDPGRSNTNSYVRSTESRGSSYNRPSSTRSSVNNRSESSYQRKSTESNSGKTIHQSKTSTRNSENSSFNNSSRSSGSGYSSGSGSSRSLGGSSSRSSGGGTSRGGRR